MIYDPRLMNILNIVCKQKNGQNHHNQITVTFTNHQEKMFKSPKKNNPHLHTLVSIPPPLPNTHTLKVKFTKNERGVKKLQFDPLIKTASGQVEYHQEIKS